MKLQERLSRGLKILVVEDNYGDFVLIQDYLQEQIEDPEIFYASTFFEAKETIEKETTLDIILLDLSLPDLNGESLVDETLALANQVPVVVLTGYANINFAIKTLSKGISDYLLKDELTSAQLYKSIIYSKERKRHQFNVTKAIVDTQEKERFEMGAELHDNVTQILAGSIMYLGLVKTTAGPSQKNMEEAKSLIQMALKEIRNISHRLAPAFFYQKSMKETFDSLLKSMKLYELYKVEFNYTGFDHETDLACILIDIYRILQEQLHNIIKYARATRIEISLEQTKEMISMRIADDGVGFNVDTVRSGIGIRNMKMRTNLYSGKFTLNSSPGNGCELIVDIPRKELRKKIV